MLDTGHHDRWLRRLKRDPRFRFWYEMERFKLSDGPRDWRIYSYGILTGSSLTIGVVGLIHAI